MDGHSVLQPSGYVRPESGKCTANAFLKRGAESGICDSSTPRTTAKHGASMDGNGARCFTGIGVAWMRVEQVGGHHTPVESAAK